MKWKRPLITKPSVSPPLQFCGLSVNYTAGWSLCQQWRIPMLHTVCYSSRWNIASSLRCIITNHKAANTGINVRLGMHLEGPLVIGSQMETFFSTQTSPITHCRPLTFAGFTRRCNYLSICQRQHFTTFMNFTLSQQLTKLSEFIRESGEFLHGDK